MTDATERRLHFYQLTLALSMLFALVGFSYNVWRMEQTERNETIRTASFEMLKSLSDLQQLIYLNHYDGDQQEGSPRRAWVQVLLIVDLSALTRAEVETSADELRAVWTEVWPDIHDDSAAVESMVASIQAMRDAIKRLIRDLE